jgi:hypothetical protein
VRALAAERGTLGQVEPLPADLAERVGPALRGSALVLGPPPRPDVDFRAERGDQVLAVLAIELAVRANHAVGGDHRREPPAGVPVVLVAGGPIFVDVLAPPLELEPKLVVRARSGRLDEGLLGPGERLRSGLAGTGERVGGGGRDLASDERIGHTRHLLECAGDADLRRGGGLGDPVSPGEPRRGRELSIRGVQTSSLGLGQAPGALGLDRARRALQ